MCVCGPCIIWCIRAGGGCAGRADVLYAGMTAVAALLTALTGNDDDDDENDAGTPLACDCCISAASDDGYTQQQHDITTHNLQPDVNHTCSQCWRCGCPDHTTATRHQKS